MMFAKEMAECLDMYIAIPRKFTWDNSYTPSKFFLIIRYSSSPEG